MTIDIIGCPSNLKIGDYVECIFENPIYNDIKEVKSISREYDVSQSLKYKQA